MTHSEQPPQNTNHFERKTLVTYDPDGRIKRREIFAPDDEARAAHGAMLQFLRESHYIRDWELRESTFVAAGMPGVKLLDNVMPHSDGRLFYKLDLKDAFPSVDIPILKGKFNPHNSMPLFRWYANAAMGGAEFEQPRPDVNTPPSSIVRSIWRFIDTYGTTPEASGLPLGAPCSPYLFNFYLQDMDRELDAYLGEYDLTYTRWLDDITVSSTRSSGVLGERMRKKIRQIIEDQSGMQLNHAKSKLHSRDRLPVTITGVDLYPDGRIQPQQRLIMKAHEAFLEAKIFFDDKNWKLSDEDPAVRHHLARVDGYRGALHMATTETSGPEVAREMDFGKVIRELAVSSMNLLSDEQIEVRRLQAIQDREAAYAEAIARQELPEETRRIAAVLGQWFPDMTAPTLAAFAETVIALFPATAVEEYVELYSYFFKD